jgi:hypothetical protein
MFQLINTQTLEVAFIGKSLKECQAYAIKKRLFTVERTKYFRHITCGYWNIERVK